MRFDAADQVVPHDPRPGGRGPQRLTHDARERRLGDLPRGLRREVRDGAARVLLPPADRAAGAEGLPDLQVLPAPAGVDGLAQGVSPQTLSIAADSPHKKEAAAFIDFLLRPENMVRLALGDWMLPDGTEALSYPALHTAKDGWATGAALAPHLRPAPAQSVRGYPEWKDKVATPAFQEYYSGAIGLAELRKRLVRDGDLAPARYQR